ncbi:MAG TPA: TetR/AcrR family transcriptional regulator [Solirubrobacteraceae bacterium]
MATVGRVRMRRPGTPGPRGGGVYVTELQRARLLDAAFAVVSEDGYRRMTARRVSGRAGVSNKTFYDLFSDREDCFLAAFDHAVEEIAAVVIPAWEGEDRWDAGIRAGLGALLGFLDGEPALRRLVFVEALGAGPRVLERRARVLEDLGSVIDQGRAGMKAGRGLPALTAEGVVGAVFSVIHTRLSQQSGWGGASRPAPLLAALNELMAMIVLPYRGPAAATRELSRPISKAGPRTLPAEGLGLLPADKSRFSGPAGRTFGSRAGRAGIPFRLTVRTHRVLCAVAELAGRGSDPNNREVSDVAGVSDQGQISKLLARLEGHGLLQNTGGSTQGIPRAWHLTPRGEEILRVGQPRSERKTAARVLQRPER